MFIRKLRDAVFTVAEIGIALVFLAWVFRDTYISIGNILGVGNDWLPHLLSVL
jgi:hypothetical protein